jgi:hypothetical protein
MTRRANFVSVSLRSRCCRCFPRRAARPVKVIELLGQDGVTLPPDELGTCWPDYVIRR